MNIAPRHHAILSALDDTPKKVAAAEAFLAMAEENLATVRAETAPSMTDATDAKSLAALTAAITEFGAHHAERLRAAAQLVRDAESRLTDAREAACIEARPGLAARYDEAAGRLKAALKECGPIDHDMLMTRLRFSDPQVRELGAVLFELATLAAARQAYRPGYPMDDPHGKLCGDTLELAEVVDDDHFTAAYSSPTRTPSGNGCSVGSGEWLLAAAQDEHIVRLRWSNDRTDHPRLQRHREARLKFEAQMDGRVEHAGVSR